MIVRLLTLKAQLSHVSTSKQGYTETVMSLQIETYYITVKKKLGSDMEWYKWLWKAPFWISAKTLSVLTG